MKIIVNGEQKELKEREASTESFDPEVSGPNGPSPWSVRGLISNLKLNPSKIVVELNGKIIKGEEWGEKFLNDKDKVEIISFVGGG